LDSISLLLLPLERISIVIWLTCEHFEQKILAGLILEK
jgi:hypothetical protein